MSWVSRTPAVTAAVGALALVLGALALNGGGTGVAAGSALVVVVSAPTALRLDADPLDGPGVYAAMSALAFGVLSLAWLGTPSLSAPGIGADEVAVALVIVSGALLAFGLAVRIVDKPQPRSELRMAPREAPSRRAVLILFALGLVGTAMSVRLGIFGYSYSLDPHASRPVLAVAQLVGQTANLGSLAVLVAAIACFAFKERPYRVLLLTLVVGQLVIGLAAGSKGATIAPIVSTGLAYIACRRRIPWRAIAIIGVFGVLVVAPANLIYRDYLREATADGTVTDPAKERLGSLPNRIYATVSSRFRLIDHVALIVDRTGSVYPYAGGTRYVTLPQLILVPRALWPDKPRLDDARLFSHTYWEISKSVRTSTPLTQVGDLYRNFGLPGVGIGMLLWGAFLAGFLRLCRRLRSPRVEMVYLASLSSWIWVVESDLPYLLAAMSKSMPFVVGVAWLMLPGRHSPPGYRQFGLWMRNRHLWRRAAPSASR